MDLHRRRSVLVRMSETGEHLETVWILNDRDVLAEVIRVGQRWPRVGSHRPAPACGWPLLESGRVPTLRAGTMPMRTSHADVHGHWHLPWQSAHGSLFKLVAQASDRITTTRACPGNPRLGWRTAGGECGVVVGLAVVRPEGAGQILLHEPVGTITVPREFFVLRAPCLLLFYRFCARDSRRAFLSSLGIRAAQWATTPSMSW